MTPEQIPWTTHVVDFSNVSVISECFGESFQLFLTSAHDDYSITKWSRRVKELYKSSKVEDKAYYKIRATNYQWVAINGNIWT